MSDVDVSGRLEFYLYEGELWCKDNNGHNILVDASQEELLSNMFTRIKEDYPEAYKALEEEYKKSAPNKIYYKYMVVKRFIKCNFGQLDSTYNDKDNEKLNFERVDCPLRLECKYDGIICSPIFKTTLSAQEIKVAKLFYDGLSKSEIAGVLYISVETANNHIRNIYHKLGVHEKAEFVNYVNNNNLFEHYRHG